MASSKKGYTILAGAVIAFVLNIVALTTKWRFVSLFNFTLQGVSFDTTTRAFAVLGAIALAAALVVTGGSIAGKAKFSMAGALYLVAGVCDIISFSVWVGNVNDVFQESNIGVGVILMIFVGIICLALGVSCFLQSKNQSGPSANAAQNQRDLEMQQQQKYQQQQMPTAQTVGNPFQGSAPPPMPISSRPQPGVAVV